MSSRIRWSAIPAARSSNAVLKTRLWLVLGALIFSSIAGTLSFFAWMANQPEPPPEIPPVPVAVDFASSALYDWLAGGGTGLPASESVNETLGGNDLPLGGVEGVSWAGFEPVTEGGRRFELHRFLLAGDPPQQLTVVVEITKAGPVLATEPALEPFTDVGAPTPAADRSESESARFASDAGQRAISEWAGAFGADNRERLRELTGDLEDRTYVGLGGLSANDVLVRSVVDGPEGTDLARVTVTFSRGEQGEAGVWQGAVSYDVLIVDGDTANPRVVAWGPPGSGPSLAPFSNGLGGSGTPAAQSTTTVAADPEAPTAPEPGN